MYIDFLKVGPLGLKAAKLVGSYIAPKILNPPIVERWAEPIFEKILINLISEEKCDVVSFGPVSAMYEPIKMLQKVCRTRSDVIGSVREQSMGVHSIFFLGKSFEDYLHSLGKNERKNSRKYLLRYLQKRFDTKVDITSNSENIEKEFEKFVNMHTQQWRKEGRLGHFKAWPNAEAFNLSLVKEFGKRNNLRLIRILADGQVISYQYTFAFGDYYYWQLPSRVIGSEWEPFSLGHTGLMNMIRLAIDEGIGRIEGGIGHYEYKIKLGAREYPAINLRITANRSGSRLRGNIFYFMFWLVNIFYHKIWYQRIQPRLPHFFQQPICSIWIRLFL